MQQWEKKTREKLYKQRIQNAKPQVPVSNKRKSNKVINESQFSSNSSISGYTVKEKEAKEQIPLYKLLKMYSLQQYAQHLITMGFGYDLMKFASLTTNDVNQLAQEIKVLPGHKVKLQSLISYIQEMIQISEPQFLNQSKSPMSTHQTTFPTKQRNSKSSKPIQAHSKTVTSKFSRPQTTSVVRQQPVKKCRVQNIGYDFFQDELDDDVEFNEALNQIMEKYRNTNEPYIEKGPTTTQTINSNRTNKTANTLNTTVPKPKIKQVSKDDINIVSQFEGEKVVTVVRDNKLLINLEKKISQNRKNKANEDENPNFPDLQISQIKHMYQSYESGKLTSTLVNLDIEEMCNCLAWCISKHVQFHKKSNTSMMKNSSIPLSMEYRFRGTGMNYQETTQNPIEEPTQINYEYSQNQPLFQSQQIAKQNNTEGKQNQTLAQISENDIENTGQKYQDDDFDSKRNQIQQLLKESLLIKNQQIGEESQISDQLDEALSEEDEDEENHYDEDYSPIKPLDIKPQEINIKQYNNMNISAESYQQDDPMYNYSSSLPHQQYQQQQQSFLQSKFDFIDADEDADKQLKDLYYKTFLDPMSELVIPSVEVISNYCKNIIITSKMEKEVAILCLVYIEKLLTQSNIQLEVQTWRRVVLIALIIASKIWDDESFENDNFAKVFPQFRTQDINEMERVFLQFIEYKLYVKQGDYAKYYFILRSYAEAKKKSFPLRPLDLNTIIRLQRCSNQAEYGLKQKYQNALNKSF